MIFCDNYEMKDFTSSRPTHTTRVTRKKKIQFYVIYNLALTKKYFSSIIVCVLIDLSVNN